MLKQQIPLCIWYDLQAGTDLRVSNINLLENTTVTISSSLQSAMLQNACMKKKTL